MKKNLRLGIIGAGSVVREIYQYLYFRSQYSPLLDVVAVADPNDEYREWFIDDESGRGAFGGVRAWEWFSKPLAAKCLTNGAFDKTQACRNVRGSKVQIRRVVHISRRSGTAVLYKIYLFSGDSSARRFTFCITCWNRASKVVEDTTGLVSSGTTMSG
ncbi:MAG: hypothetical protein WCR20_16225, partial [Verrucomicrobiota bacterium]